MSIINRIYLILLSQILSTVVLHSAEPLSSSALIPSDDKTVRAVRAQELIQIDGVLSESVWQQTGYSDFVQSDPLDGSEPTEKTTVWVAYDDNSIYIAARLYDTEPDKIIARLGRRDDRVESDWFDFCIDPYFDRQTGFQFSVNPAGTITDMVLYNDSWNDSNWDGAWESATSIDKEGWIVEMRIPYSQLRFKQQDEYIWGINFKRTIKRKNEVDSYIWIPKAESGFVSRFAKLEGISGIDPKRLIEITPFTVGQDVLSPSQEGNPFKTGKDYLGNAGADFKLGLKRNLILDLAVNPDFGQVEVDPAVLNLSAYETYYNEKRPFFIEGSKIFHFGYGGSNSYWSFNWGSPDFFYSRRIGHAPQGSVSSADAYTDSPVCTTILSAAKITGKISNGWNIGILDAVTQREYSTLSLDGNQWDEEIEPFTNHFVARVQREFAQGRQGLGFITTNVVRNLRTSMLKEEFNSTASSFAIDGWTFLDSKKVWVLTGWFGTTHITGSKDRIYDVQQSSLHYFQRPDADHLSLDPNATSMTGYAGRLLLNKQQGNWFLNTAVGAISPGFDSSDLGFQWSFDKINAHFCGGYNSFHPGKYLRNWTLGGAAWRCYDFGGTVISSGYMLLSRAQLLNYWGATLDLFYTPEFLSNTFTRGGPLMLLPASAQMRFSTYSDNRKPLFFQFYGYIDTTNSELFIQRDFYTQITWKPKSNISLSIKPGYYTTDSALQWVNNIDDEAMKATYGIRYVFATINQKRFETGIRANWIFTPKLSLQLYLQPFIAVGKYSKFKELSAPSTGNFNYYGNGYSRIVYENGNYMVDPDGNGPAEPFSFGNPDFNYKSLRGTVVLRWEYRLGSAIYFVWSSSREDDSYPGDFNFRRDITDLFKASGNNTLLVKFTYQFNF